jgi:putative transposase
MSKISYNGYGLPPEIIQHAIWLYYRFTMSLRDVEDLLAERSIIVSYETIRRWVNHFGPRVAADLRKRPPKSHATWHLDNSISRSMAAWSICGAPSTPRAKCSMAALNLMRKLLKKYAFVLERLLADDLRSCAAAAHALGLSRRHERGRCCNNRAENSRQPTRLEGVWAAACVERNRRGHHQRPLWGLTRSAPGRAGRQGL